MRKDRISIDPRAHSCRPQYNIRPHIRSKWLGIVATDKRTRKVFFLNFIKNRVSGSVEEFDTISVRVQTKFKRTIKSEKKQKPYKKITHKVDSSSSDKFFDRPDASAGRWNQCGRDPAIVFCLLSTIRYQRSLATYRKK